MSPATDEIECLKSTIRDMLPFVEKAERGASGAGIAAAMLHGLVSRARGQIGVGGPRLPQVPYTRDGDLVVVMHSADAAMQMAAGLGEHTTYPHLVASLKNIAGQIDPEAGKKPGAWWTSRSPLPALWVEALSGGPR